MPDYTYTNLKQTLSEYYEEHKKMKDMLKSKKFIAAVVGLIVALAAEAGLDLDTESILTILSPILSYIIGQGIADQGKEAAKVQNGQ